MAIDLNDLEVFAAVVRAQSFTDAGKTLGIPTSAVSRRIARLEDAAGIALLHRTTRRVSTTEAGRMLFERTKGIPGLVDDALRAISTAQDEASGTLRVTAPPDDHGVIWSLLQGFALDHPKVDLDIRHTLDRIDLLKEGFDLAIRGGEAPDTSTFAAQQLFDSRILLAASPAYLHARGTPAAAEDLADHDGVCMDGWAPNAIRQVHGDRGYVRVQMRSRLRANSLATAQRAALAGLGIAPVLELTCIDDLREGRLVEVLRGALPDHAPMWVLFPLGRARSAAATAFVAHIVGVAREMSTARPA